MCQLLLSSSRRLVLSTAREARHYQHTQLEGEATEVGERQVICPSRGAYTQTSEPMS